jgi:hypothetical protein
LLAHHIEKFIPGIVPEIPDLAQDGVWSRLRGLLRRGGVPLGYGVDLKPGAKTGDPADKITT